jgi:hypothetical protein
MRNLLYSVVALASLSTICSAQTLTETFGSGANAFTMEFVTIGNPNNVADTTGSPNPAGSVAYTYNIGKYEVSREQIDKANAAGSLGITMSGVSPYGGNGLLRPATGINWYEAAIYANWLNTSTGGTAAYKFDGSGNFQLWSAGDAGYNANNKFRNSLAKYVIASGDEWYKAAYGNLDGTWNKFPTGSDSAPTPVASGTDANTAVYLDKYGPADINNAGGLSAYGTMAQGGNVQEWNETAFDGTNDATSEDRTIRGGGYPSRSSMGLEASNRNYYALTDEGGYFGNGFRVASVPEPSSLSLLVLGGVVVALGRRRK